MTVRMSPTLDALYRATAYRAFVPDEAPINLRVGEHSTRLDRLLTRHDAHEWAFITAWNPESRELSDDENDARHAELVGIVRERGWRWFEGAGLPAGSDWKPEASLLVLGISKDEALVLGRRFDQNAIVMGQRGAPAELVYCAAA